jgi:NADPH:quinone reductase-like Zn-dependent oxidoreductase
VKAVVFHEFGGLDTLQLEEVPDPKPGPGEVLIDIAATALNHLDIDGGRGSPGSRSSRRSSSASRSSGASPRSARASRGGRSATA